LVSGDWRRFGAVDVHYPPVGGAWAALVVAAEARFATLIDERGAWLDEIAPYQPGQFFARELPAIRAVIPQADDVDLVVIDGHVDLDPDGRPGLGAHLHTEVGVPVVGVAKTAFRTATHAVAIYRGKATRPLYVTAIGVRIEQAAAMVTDMAGRHRIPDALRRVDSLARNARRGTH
jgi:deoxyribonuclease V